MQPSLILPIILKDLRANRWLFAAFFAATILITVTSFVRPQDPGPLARSGMVLVYLLSALLALLAMARDSTPTRRLRIRPSWRPAQSLGP